MAKTKKETFQDFLEQLQVAEVKKGRPIETIEERKYFLIVCEGVRTEPIYFDYIKRFLPNNLLETIEISGEGDNTINIVRIAIRKKEERAINILLPDFDEVWAVFDKDDFPKENYDNAILLANRKGIECGVSNQSFELWYVLHFQLLETALHRKDYIAVLTKLLGFKYEKNNKKIIKLLFEKGNVRQAIEWAKHLENMHIGKSPSSACPSTRVYELVERLLAYSKFDSQTMT
jgi:hypothetical protein